MFKIFSFIAVFMLVMGYLFSQVYTFDENIRITEFSDNQKFPEIAIDENYIHLAWVSISGNNKNIMYSRSNNFGESFSPPLQLNFHNNDIVAFSQSGPRVSAYENKVYITYMDDRTGSWAIYLNTSEDYGNTWQEEVLISDTSYLNGYPDFEIDMDGNLHLIYYNYAANNHLEDVRYRFSFGNDINFYNSTQVGIVDESMEPCDCCQPDLEIDDNGDVYIAYRNNILNNRDTFLAIKRYNQDAFSEYYQVSNFNDYITFCPSSGPTIDIKDNHIAVAFTVYYTQNGYTNISNLDAIDFANPININTESNGFPNYPYVLFDDNIHIVWTDQASGNWDVYYGMRDIITGEMQNIQKINNDDTNYVQKDQIIYMYDDTLYLFWSDQRDGSYEIYLSKGESTFITPGDINQDMSVDILDVIILVNFILGQQEPTNIQFMAADINEDNIINIQDVILLINLILE